MGKISTGLFVDGVEVVEGTTRAVAHYVRLLREAEEKLGEARTFLAYVPDEVERAWRERHTATDKKLSPLLSAASRFSEEFTRRGLDFAVGEARFRKEL